MKIEHLYEAKRIDTGNGMILSNIRRADVKPMLDRWGSGIRGCSDRSGVDCGSAMNMHHGVIMHETGNNGDVMFCIGKDKKSLRNMDHGNLVIFEMQKHGFLLEVIACHTEDDWTMRNMMLNITNVFGPLKLKSLPRHQLTRAFDEMNRGDILG